MKKTLLIALTTLAVLVALTATAERRIWLYSHSGNHVSLPVTDLDSISFETPTVLELSDYTKKFDSKGGGFTLGITTNQAWKAEVNNPIAVTLSKITGTGSDEIAVTAMENTGAESYSAIVTITALNGMYKQLILTVEGKSSPTTEKCKASDYPTVTIGTQTWMAENYRCSKYDTQSEAYNASWLTNNTVPTSESAKYTPYYADASDKSKWYDTEYAGNVTDAQVKKLGYLYNWAAAVGVADGEKQITDFSGKRQGICPNGWHIPSRAEWQALYDYIYKDKNLSSNEVGKYLKTTSGWYDGDIDYKDYKPGLDSYGFAALPAGSAGGSEVYAVGCPAYFWTNAPFESISDYAYFRALIYYDDHLYDDYYVSKRDGQSVRCLKN